MIFGRFFKKKKKEEVETKSVEQEKNTTPTGMVCDYCKADIYGEQKIKTVNGKKYHLKPCWRKLFKEMKKEIIK